MPRLRELGEHKVLEKILEVLAVQGRVPGLGDDATPLNLSGTTLIFKIDGFSLEGFRLPWMTLYDVGWKAVVATASDVIAKGGAPKLVAISLGVNPDKELSELLEIVQGALDASKHVGAVYAGGDTNASVGEWIDVAMVGIASRFIPGRVSSEAVLYTTVGRYGLSSLAFHILMEGGDIRAYPNAFRETRRPRPRLEFLKLAEEAGDCIVAASDVSDGFFSTLVKLVRGTRFTVVLEGLPTLHPEASEYLDEKRLDMYEFLSRGGEEYEIIFCVRKDCVDIVERIVKRLNLCVERIGFIAADASTGGMGLYCPIKEICFKRIVSRHSRREEIKTIGWWDQFKGWTYV